jgi:hypothetical protein
MKLSSKSYWQVNLNSVTVGSAVIDLSIKSLVFDSGASLMYVPTKDYRKLTTAIFASPNTASCSLDTSSGITFCDCTSIKDSRYPTIELKMGNQYTFYLNGSDYLIYESSRKKCIFGFIEDTSSLNFWLVGDPIFRAYLIIHDMDE